MMPAKNIRPPYLPKVSGAPGKIRTPDLLIRSQMLYPAELRAHTPPTPQCKP